MITTRRPGSMSRADAAAARHSVRCSLAAAGNRTTWPGMGQKPDLLRARLALSRPLRLCGVMPARACLELHDRVDSRGISLRGAAIVGCLDLAGIEVPYPLRFDGCVFDSAPSFEGANLHELALTGCDKNSGPACQWDTSTARPESVTLTHNRRPLNQRQHIEEIGDLAL